MRFSQKSEKDQILLYTNEPQCLFRSFVRKLNSKASSNLGELLHVVERKARNHITGSMNSLVAIFERTFDGECTRETLLSPAGVVRAGISALGANIWNGSIGINKGLQKLGQVIVDVISDDANNFTV